MCGEGYSSDGYSCYDINECVVSEGTPCTGQDMVCVNTEGSYVCQCKPGYEEAEGGSCEGEDEGG